jgi:hypothetical protein
MTPELSNPAGNTVRELGVVGITSVQVRPEGEQSFRPLDFAIVKGRRPTFRIEFSHPELFLQTPQVGLQFDDGNDATALDVVTRTMPSAGFAVTGNAVEYMPSNDDVVVPGTGRMVVVAQLRKETPTGSRSGQVRLRTDWLAYAEDDPGTDGAEDLVLTDRPRSFESGQDGTFVDDEIVVLAQEGGTDAALSAAFATARSRPVGLLRQAESFLLAASSPGMREATRLLLASDQRIAATSENLVLPYAAAASEDLSELLRVGLPPSGDGSVEVEPYCIWA